MDGDLGASFPPSTGAERGMLQQPQRKDHDEADIPISGATGAGGWGAAGEEPVQVPAPALAVRIPLSKSLPVSEPGSPHL